MPWRETSPMNERLHLCLDYERGLGPMTELAAEYGVSEKTGYKWYARFSEVGVAGLLDQSRAPHHRPQAMGDTTIAAILAAKYAHRDWGPRKLRDHLRLTHPDRRWPAISSIGELLARHGLVRRRRRRRRVPPMPLHLPPPTAPNERWSIDFKGEFATGGGQLCYPLTVTDNYSRYLLGCTGLTRPTGDGTRHVLHHLFREYGLPIALQSDNGSPFASRGLGRLSRLSVWWIRLGIRPVLNAPRHPEHNARHERMHRTLKAATARPPAASLRAQQQRFDAFRRSFNDVRPHEALGGVPPATYYQASDRSYPRRLAPLEYAPDLLIRRVTHNGTIGWNAQPLYINIALRGELVALREVADGVWTVYFGPYPLGRLHERNMEITPLAGLSASPMSPV